MTSSDEKNVRVTGPLCGKFTGKRWIPLTKARTRSFFVFFDLRLNKQLGKQSRRRWFEMPSPSLWRHCNATNEIWLSRKVSYSKRIGWCIEFCLGIIIDTLITHMVLWKKFRGMNYHLGYFLLDGATLSGQSAGCILIYLTKLRRESIICNSWCNFK